MHVAKIFKNGHSQAVRLPKMYRIEGAEVSITKIGTTIMLQPLYASWMEIYKQMVAIPDFMDDREDLPPQAREEL